MSANSIPSDCVICLSKLQKIETDFPLLCPNKCTNICTKCLTHLKVSSESGPSSCPKCRASLPDQVMKDTHFMRCVRELEAIVQAGITDSEMSGAELRLKYSVTPVDIEDAKKRLEVHEEAGYHCYVQPLVNTQSFNSQTQHDEILSPMSHKIDTRFLGGLEAFTSEEEQIYITELMTSGITRKLAQAAQILSEIKHIHAADKIQNDNIKKISSLWSRSNTGEEERAIQTTMSNPDSIDLPPMPKYVFLKANFDVYARRGKVIKFKDDGWNGTMADAFARVYVSNPNNNSDDGSEDDEDKDEEFGDEDGFLNDGDKNKNRVIVTCARREIFKAGIEVGDVVTHINSDEFLGTAEDLRSLIHNFYLDDDVETFTMVLNAEQSTAATLKKCAKH